MCRSVHDYEAKQGWKFILINGPLGTKRWQRIMEMQSPQLHSKCLIIKTSKYNNRMCSFWYVAEPLLAKQLQSTLGLERGDRVGEEPCASTVYNLTGEDTINSREKLQKFLWKKYKLITVQRTGKPSRREEITQ